ncbi:ATP-dependent_DNA helicase [Hexamita inflata]|uniref:ATP-dependent DNA helicase n=1 Tax=Hexamita inflata TaxID=28002 RepID=A0AA86QVG5_9EUKA|nr:ATP-dependent DNA helicase [Hexamita inflata]
MNGMWSDSAIQTQKKVEHYQKLTFEQKMIFNEIVFNRKNAYIAGITCSGKSHLIRSITKSLQAMFGDKIFVTAISRSGAQNINGQLLQHIFKLKVDKIYDTIAENEQFIFQNVKQNLYMQIMFKELQVLIIDEVSMLPGYIFDATSMDYQYGLVWTCFFNELKKIQNFLEDYKQLYAEISCSYRQQAKLIKCVIYLTAKHLRTQNQRSSSASLFLNIMIKIIYQYQIKYEMVQQVMML